MDRANPIWRPDGKIFQAMIDRDPAIEQQRPHGTVTTDNSTF
jgi:hypothetical protein